MGSHWRAPPGPSQQFAPGPSQQPFSLNSYAAPGPGPGPGPAATFQQRPPPAAAAGGSGGDGCLRSVDELPPCFRPVFRFRYFNAIQNECWPAIYGGQSNVIIAAPTGGGKTALLELAILRMLARNVDGAGQLAHKPGHLKAIYLAPARALVQEKAKEWTQRFGPLGITCRELTGDTDWEGMECLDTADIICATPEKFDAVTRSGMRFFADISLVLIDEVHLLNESRGSSLEGVISRIKMVGKLREMRDQPIGSVRFVAVSATIPNVQDLAEWLGAPTSGIKCFGEEMRPVKLRTVVRGYNPTKTDFLFERRLNDHIYSVIADFSSGKPSLVFCSSRKGTSETAAHLAREARKVGSGFGSGGQPPSAFVQDAPQQQRLAHAAGALKDTHLRDCVLAGVGYHHAAMEPEERAAVEQLFLAQDLSVLCTTSTLAMGVNLPARLVVLKSTRRYVGHEAEDASGYQEYERSTCLQMVGRAGRPQFDTEGVAVIMTQMQHVQRYEQLMSGSELVESTLKEVLPELLNAEITLRTITDVSQAIDWLRSTYLYVRVKRDPARYGVPRTLLQPQQPYQQQQRMGQQPYQQQQHRPQADELDKWLKEKLVLATIQELSQHGMVRLHDDGFSLEPLKPGQIMAEKYIRMRTMASLGSAPQGAAIPDLLYILARSTELSNIKLRRSEKKVLNEINHSTRVRHAVMNPTKPGKVLERISGGDHKIFILFNEGLADTPTDKLEYSLKQDVEQVVTVGKRIASAMVKYFEHVGKASETFNALLLCKSLHRRMWTDSQLETRQLPGIGPLIAQRLASQGVHKLRQLADIEPRRLETLAQRHFPFGNEVRAALEGCLPPNINLQCLPVAWLPGGLVELEVRVERVSSTAAKSPACLLVGSLHDNTLLLCRPLALEQFPSPLVLRTRTKTRAPGVGAPVQVVASVVHERLVGVDVAVKTVVPAGAQLQGTACVQLPAQAEARDAPAEQGMGDEGPGLQQQQPQPQKTAVAAAGPVPVPMPVPGAVPLPQAARAAVQVHPDPEPLPPAPPVQPTSSVGAGSGSCFPAHNAIKASVLSVPASQPPPVPHQRHQQQHSQQQLVPAGAPPRQPLAPSANFQPRPVGGQQQSPASMLPLAAQPGMAGKGKWGSFVPPPPSQQQRQKAAASDQPVQQQRRQMTLQESVRHAAAANPGHATFTGSQHRHQQAAALPGTASSVQASHLGGSPPGSMAEPGGLFSRFALSRKPAGVAPQALVKPAPLQPGSSSRGLFSKRTLTAQPVPLPPAGSVCPPDTTTASCVEEHPATAKRQRLGVSPGSSAAGFAFATAPPLTATAPAIAAPQPRALTMPTPSAEEPAAGAAAPKRGSLNLPKLGWLSSIARGQAAAIAETPATARPAAGAASLGSGALQLVAAGAGSAVSEAASELEVDYGKVFSFFL